MDSSCYRYPPKPTRYSTQLESQIDASFQPAPQRGSFTSLANRDFRIYVLAGSAAMMADNIEHVISYWVVFQKFHSPALGAFAVVSHWAPYLLFAAYTGGLADRFDVRRLIQIGMLLFMGVSVGWGVMFATDSTQQWKAGALLIVHGLAGVIWMPASQVLIHRIVGAAAGAERGAAQRDRSLSGVSGGSGGRRCLAVGFWTRVRNLLNALIYLPMFVWLIKAPYGRGSRGCAAAAAASADCRIYGRP